MPTRLSTLTRNNVEKCRAATIAAVESYNRPNGQFRTPTYIVLIVIAWQAFFHAYYYRRNKKPWYQSRSSEFKKGVRYERVDGEPKHWDLSRCLKEYFQGEQHPERKNLEFLLGLRNKIEHRHLPQLDLAVYGECQACLINLEDYLVREFGGKYALTESLNLSLQFSRTRPQEQVKSIKSLAKNARDVLEYIEHFRLNLNDQVWNDMGYSYRVFLVPKVVSRENSADVAVEFINADQINEIDEDRLKKLNVLIKDRHIPIVNLDLKKPAEVALAVSESIPFRFRVHHHTMAWKYFKVRPPRNNANPEKTKPSFCVYDAAHQDYLYTSAWVRKLVNDLSDPIKYKLITKSYPQED